MKDETVLDKIKKIASEMYKEIMAKQKPQLKMPLRSLSNVSYEQKDGYFEMGEQFKERTLTVNTIKTFAQTLKMLSLSKILLKPMTLQPRERPITFQRTGAMQNFQSSRNQTQSWMT